jgi:hypothetical protein
MEDNWGTVCGHLWSEADIRKCFIDCLSFAITLNKSCMSGIESPDVPKNWKTFSHAMVDLFYGFHPTSNPISKD